LFHNRSAFTHEQKKKKETLMTQTSKTLVPVVTSDHDGALVSRIFASRPGLVTTEPREHETGRAVMASIAGLEQGDFVVRSVRAGKRRSIQVLAGSVPADFAMRIAGFDDIEDNRLPAFDKGNVIVLTNGDDLVELHSAVLVN